MTFSSVEPIDLESSFCRFNGKLMNRNKRSPSTGALIEEVDWSRSTCDGVLLNPRGLRPAGCGRALRRRVLRERRRRYIFSPIGMMKDKLPSALAGMREARLLAYLEKKMMTIGQTHPSDWRAACWRVLGHPFSLAIRLSACESSFRYGYRRGTRLFGRVSHLRETWGL